MTARVVQVFGETITVAVKPRDYAQLDDELLIVFPIQEAVDLMHALEGWKDER